MAWFKTWFNTPYYHLLYQNRDYQEAETFITKLVSYLQLPKGADLIDLACGKGRHSIFLNKLGYNVLGLDLSVESIEHDKAFEKLHEPILKFDVHDMRDPISGQPVDAVLNLFTSFGYFEDPKDDYSVFCSVYNILKPGGIFVLDFLNETYVKNNLVPQQIVERGEIIFHITRRIEDNHVIKDIAFEDQGEKFEFFEKVKLHSLEEITVLAKQNRFSVAEVFGDYQLHGFEASTSPRCITVLKKHA